MGAHVIPITDQRQWEVIEAFLNDCRDGAIVLGPAAIAAFRETHGERPRKQLLPDYDFGGEADIWIDWFNGSNLKDAKALLPIDAIVQAQNITTGNGE